MIARRWWRNAAALLLGGILAIVALAQPAPLYGDALYQPRLRQPGKDVMWLPTPDTMVARMLAAARTGPGDIVYDLGAGEGRIPIAAARDFGAAAVGIEYDAPLAALAARNVVRAGVADRVRIIHGDVFKEDFTRATVVTLYLLPELNHQLRPQLLALKPGTRVVSYMWDMGEWEPDDTMLSGGEQAFLWTVPAVVDGRWTVRGSAGKVVATLALTQQFQRIGGTISIEGKTQPLLGAFVQGPTLGFTFVGADGGIRSARLAVDDRRAVGAMIFVNQATPITARRD
ncbi:MAG: class I SAM-dependent methyltransferase [Betaproteobacteria bacterium]